MPHCTTTQFSEAFGASELAGLTGEDAIGQRSIAAAALAIIPCRWARCGCAVSGCGPYTPPACRASGSIDLLATGRNRPRAGIVWY